MVWPLTVAAEMLLWLTAGPETQSINSPLRSHTELLCGEKQLSCVWILIEKKQTNFFIVMFFFFLIALNKSILPEEILHGKFFSSEEGDLGMGLSLIRWSLVWIQEEFTVCTTTKLRTY